jgi:stage II sporulation protein D
VTRRTFLSLVAAFLSSPRLVARAMAPGPDGRALRILRTGTGRVEEIPVEVYVAAVLPGEIGRRAPAAALESQAVAARSYAIARRSRHDDEGADLCDGVHCQVFRGLESATSETRAAAAATDRMVLVQAGRVIAAPFHAVCGGRTARPRDVWDDEENPDLIPVEDDACREAPGYSWSFSIPRREIPRLAVSLGIPEARFLEVYGRDDTGRVSMIRFAAPGGVSRVVRGFDFRKAASAIWGWASVRSTAFEMAESRTEYFLTGHGTGHGAGMCQAGAIERARRGESRDSILAHYYRGAELERLTSYA